MKRLGCMLFALLLMLVVPGFAQSASVSFSVTPLLLELNGAPGSKQPFYFEVINQTAEREAKLHAYVVPITQSKDGNYIVADKATAASAVSWVKLSTPDFTVPGGNVYVLAGELTIPRNYQGGAYVGIIFELAPDKKEEGTTVSIGFSQRFLAVLEITVRAGTPKRNLQISELKVTNVAELNDPNMADIVQRYGKSALLFSAMVSNVGNIHVFTQGSVTLRDAGGRKINEFPLGTGRGAVIPGAEVEFGSIITSGLPDGEYSMQVVMRYGGLRPAIAKQTFTIGKGALEQGNAAHPLRMLVEPEQIDIDIKPGALRTALVRVQNMESEPIIVSGKALPLAYDEAGELITDATATAYSAADWVDVRPDEIRLTPGQRRNIQLMLPVPKDVTGGGRYALVNLTGRFENDPDGKGVTSDEMIPLILHTADNLVRSAEIADTYIQVAPDNTQVGVAFSYKNTGNIHVQPSGKVAIYKLTYPDVAAGVEYIGEPNRQLVAETPLNDLPGPVLPGETRFMGALTTIAPEPGEYLAEISLNYGLRAPMLRNIEFILPILDDTTRGQTPILATSAK